MRLNYEENQAMIAERGINPDFYRLYEEWQKKELGPDQGKPLFDRLNDDIAAYNGMNSIKGGKAALQIFKGLPTVTSDSTCRLVKLFQSIKKSRRATDDNSNLYTPLMSRVHQHIRQASEMVFCDSTSSLDWFNTSLFILSTSHPTGGLPLAAMITSNEQQITINQGLEMIKDVIPENAFYGSGPDRGPAVIMTDDCSYTMARIVSAMKIANFSCSRQKIWFMQHQKVSF